MKILVVGDYPRPGHQFTSLFNERCVKVLDELCDRVEVMAHRPYFPSIFSFAGLVPRWQTWANTKVFEVRDGISIQRPAYPQIPKIGSAFWVDRAAFFCCRRKARELHQRIGFDAIVSFDLLGAGGLAWRLAYDLGIPASGWAFGNDLRQPRGSALEGVVLRAIMRLNLVFYQSHELFEMAARLLGINPELMPKDRHVVLSHGIPEPPPIPNAATRNRIRSALGIREEQVLVLSVGSIVREKGVFELLDAISLAADRDARITCVLVGSLPAFDQTATIQEKLNCVPSVKNRVRLLPACSPDTVWEYLCAADIFAFTSHYEGMPNSLLEGMSMGLPAIAFAIPPVIEVEAGTGCLVTVLPFDSQSFAESILRLAACLPERINLGQKGRAQVMERFMVRKNMAKALGFLTETVAKRSSHDVRNAKEMPGVTAYHSSTI